MNVLKTCSNWLAIGCAIASSSAGAATCNGTQGSFSPQSGPPGTVVGNNCTHNSNYNGSTFCGGVSFSNTGTDVYQLQVGTTQGLTFSVTSSAFTPDIALLANSCADNATCTVEGSNGTGTVQASVPDNSPATYFVVITDSTGIGAQCGSYNLSFAAPLPVKLLDFSVR